MYVALISFFAGIIVWTALEYAVHGWLAHVMTTFVSPIHDAHHRNPAAVFAIGTWPPAIAIWISCIVRFGVSPGTLILTGIMAGFLAYEVVHYRFHFIRPASRIESYLRVRHLYHHQRNPGVAFGVTTPLWDCIFATDANTPASDFAALRRCPPLSGPSNLGAVASRVVAAASRNRLARTSR